MPSNCGTGEDFWKSSRQRGDWSWIFTERTDAEADASVFWSSDVNRWLIGKSLMLGKIEGRSRRENQRMKWLASIIDAVNMNLDKLRRWWGSGRPGMLQSMGSQRVRHDWKTELKWTELYISPYIDSNRIYIFEKKIVSWASLIQLYNIINYSITKKVFSMRLDNIMVTWEYYSISEFFCS